MASTHSYFVGSNTLVVTLSLCRVAVAHQTARREAAQTLTQTWHHQCVYLSLFHHIHDATYYRGSKDHRDPSHEVGQVWVNEGYLILIIALHSIYLNLYHDVTNGSREGVSQACTDNSSAHQVCERPHIQEMDLNELWCDSVDLCTIAQESHTAIPVDSYSGYVLDSVPMGKGINIQEGSLGMVFYTQVVPPWGAFRVVAFSGGLGLPSLVPSPPSGLKVSPPQFLPAMGNHR